MRELTIDGVRIADDTDCYVVAEIGHNHQGDVEKARELIAVAARCGANAVKLQKRDNRTLFVHTLYEKPYEHENSFGPTYGTHREALELDRDDYLELAAFASELGLAFFATAFDVPSADFLRDLNLPAFKVASGDLTNTPLLTHIARFGTPMILSTGGATLEDVERAVDTIFPINPNLALLQCTAAYPCEFEEMNLRVIETYRKRFPELVIGLSAHDNGIAMPLVAYTLGARIVEKHFTLNHAWKGTDHAFSLEPEGLRRCVRDLRRARVALGDGVKRRHASEERPLEKMSKSIVAARDLERGQVLCAEDLSFKSPGTGLSPHHLETLVGTTLTRPVAADDALTLEHIGVPEPSIADPTSAAA